MKRLELLLVYTFAFSTAICFLNQPLLGQGDLADEAVALEEAWMPNKKSLKKSPNWAVGTKPRSVLPGT